MAKLTKHSKKLLGRILRDMDLVSESQVQEALAIQKSRGGAIGDILVELNHVTEEDLALALATQSGMELVELGGKEIPSDLISRISSSVAQVYRVVPVKYENGVLTVALADPTHLKTLDDLRFLIGGEVQGAVARPEDVQDAIDKYYSTKEDVQDVLQELDQEWGEAVDFVGTESQSIEIESLEEMANIAPVRKLLNLVLLQAIKDKASDIHFEPFEDDFKIRYRVDGVLYEMVPPPKHLHLAISSRLKVMTQTMDIAERRVPQDGRIQLNIAGNPVDMRVSTLPTMYGESVVLRVLDRRRVALDMDKLGLRTDDTEKVNALLKRPYGIVLVTGPTGCGKTTTLYSALRQLNDVGVKIITTEDPVEYDLEGIMQMEVKPDGGVTFATSLRHILRQDPDMILVGEIRDRETGEIAIQASLTGHLVFSTTHTNDAATAITRLIDLGLEPYLLCATLEGIVAQRLVRRICPNCREEYEPSAQSLLELDLRPEDVVGKKFYRGRGCDMCNNIGYRGRMGIFEILTINEELRELMLADASTSELRDCGRRHGSRSLREGGLLAVYDGLTTIEEIVRETLAS